MPFVPPVEQVAQKRKATSPLMPHQSETRPTSPTAPTRSERAQSRLKGRYRSFITPPLENITDFTRELPSRRWQQLPKEMGTINMGLVDEHFPSAALILTHFHGELYQQAYVDSSVPSDTSHALLRSVLGDDYRTLVPSICSLRKCCPWLQLRDRS